MAEMDEYMNEGSVEGPGASLEESVGVAEQPGGYVEGPGGAVDPGVGVAAAGPVVPSSDGSEGFVPPDLGGYFGGDAEGYGGVPDLPRGTSVTRSLFGGGYSEQGPGDGGGMSFGMGDRLGMSSQGVPDPSAFMLPGSSLGAPSNSIESFDLRQAMDDIKSEKPSFQARTAPIFFDWNKSQAERYVQSDYMKDIGFRPYDENESRYAAHQTWGDTLSNAFGGMRELAWNTFVDGWKGWGRLASAVWNWDKSKLMGDAEDLEELHRQQEEIFNKYAIYSTPESEKEFFNRQFFGNLIQQSGFALGAFGQMVTENLVLMGLGNVVKPFTIAGAAARIGRAGYTSSQILADATKAGGVYKSASFMGKLYHDLKTGAQAVGGTLRKASQLTPIGKEVADAVKAGKKWWEVGLAGVGSLTRSLMEFNMASVEARQEAAELYVNLKDQLREDIVRRKGSVSAEDEAWIEQHAMEGASYGYGANVVLLSVMNRLSLGNVMRTFGMDLQMARQLASEGIDIAGTKAGRVIRGTAARDIVDKAGKVVVKKGDRLSYGYTSGAFGRLGNFRAIKADFGARRAWMEAGKSVAGAVGRASLEGLEEEEQEIIKGTIKNYYGDLGKGEAASLYHSIVDASSDQVSREGFKTFLMGTLTGGIVGPVAFGVRKGIEKIQRGKNAGEIEKAKKEAIGNLNTFLIDPKNYISRWAENTNIQNRMGSAMDEAVENRDKYGYINAKNIANDAAFWSIYEANMDEAVTGEIEYLARLPKERLNEMFGPRENDDWREHLTGVATGLKDYVKYVRETEKKFSDYIRPERYAEEDRGKINLARQAFNQIIRESASSHYMAKEADKRRVGILQEATKIEGVGQLAHLAFNILSDKSTMTGRIALLKSEIATDEQAPNPTPDVLKRIERKRKELKALEDILASGITEATPKVGPARAGATSGAPTSSEKASPEVRTGGERPTGAPPGAGAGAGRSEVRPEAEPVERLSSRKEGSEGSTEVSPAAERSERRVEPGRSGKEAGPAEHFSLDKRLAAYRAYIEAVGEESGFIPSFTDQDIDQFHILLEDYRKLGVDIHGHHLARALVAKPREVLHTFIEYQRALGAYRKEVLKDATAAMERAAQARAAEIGAATSTQGKTTAEGGDEDAFDEAEGPDDGPGGPGGGTGGGGGRYKKFKVGQFIRRKGWEGLFYINGISDRGIELVNLDRGTTFTYPLSKFGKLIEGGEIEKVKPVDVFGKTHFDPGMQLMPESRGGVFIVKLSPDREEYMVVDRDMNSVQEDIVSTDRTYTSLGAAQKAMNSILKLRGLKREAQSFVFKGMRLMAGDILEDRNGNEYRVVRKGRVEGEDMLLLRRDDIEKNVQVRSVKGRFRLKQKAGLAPVESAEGTMGAGGKDDKRFKLRKPRLPISVYAHIRDKIVGKKRKELSAEERQRLWELRQEAQAELDRLLRETPQEELLQKLTIHIRPNLPAEAEVAEENDVHENRNLRLNPEPYTVELRYNDQPIGYLTYYNRYQYQDNNRKVYDTGKLTKAQFAEIFDLRGKTANQADILREEFIRAYRAGEQVNQVIEQLMAGSPKGVVLSGAQVQSLFDVRVSPGSYDFVKQRKEQPTVALKDFKHNTVGGHKVVLVKQRQYVGDTEFTETKEVLVSEPPLSAEAEAQLWERIKEARYNEEEDRDRDAEMGSYLAIVELGNKQLKFVDLAIPAAEADDLAALTDQLNKQIEATLKDNVVLEGGEEEAVDEGFNDAFNEEVLGKIFVATQLKHEGLYIKPELNAFGEIELNYWDNRRRTEGVVVVRGKGGKALRFGNFQEVLNAMNEAIARYNEEEEGTPLDGKRIALSHIKKNISKDAGWDELQHMLVKVGPNVVKNIGITVRAKKGAVKPVEVQPQAPKPPKPGGPGTGGGGTSTRPGGGPVTTAPPAAGGGTVAAQGITIEERKKEVERIKTLPFQERITALKKAGIITDVYSYGTRPVVVVNIAGIQLPFYRSSKGTSGKEKGKWFPFFGFGKNSSTDTELNWLIKGDLASMERNFDSKALQEYSDIINKTLNWDHSYDLEDQFLNPNPFFMPFVTFKGSEEVFNKRVFGEENRGVVWGDGSAQKAYAIIPQIEAAYKATLAREGATKIARQKAEIEQRRQAALLTPADISMIPGGVRALIQKTAEGLSMAKRYALLLAAFAGHSDSAIASSLQLFTKEGKPNADQVRMVRQYYGIPSHVRDFKRWKERVSGINAAYDAEVAKLEGREVDTKVEPGTQGASGATSAEQGGTGAQAGGAAGTEAGTKASKKLMITRDDRQQLYDLGYTKADVDSMKPEDAGVILEGGISKGKAAVGTSGQPAAGGAPGEVGATAPVRGGGERTIEQQRAEVEKRRAAALQNTVLSPGDQEGKGLNADDVVLFEVNGRSRIGVVRELGESKTKLIYDENDEFWTVPDVLAQAGRLSNVTQQQRINAEYDAELAKIEAGGAPTEASAQADGGASAAVDPREDIERRRQEALDKVKTVYTHERADAGEVPRHFQIIPEYGDALNAFTSSTSSIARRLGTAVEGEVNDAEFVAIDATKTPAELYASLKAQGYQFSKDYSKWTGLIQDFREDAIEFFTDFQQSNPEVKGIRVSNHSAWGGVRLPDFYVVYDEGGFYEPGFLKAQINEEYDDELARLEGKGDPSATSSPTATKKPQDKKPWKSWKAAAEERRKEREVSDAVAMVQKRAAEKDRIVGWRESAMAQIGWKEKEVAFDRLNDQLNKAINGYSFYKDEAIIGTIRAIRDIESVLKEGSRLSETEQQAFDNAKQWLEDQGYALVETAVVPAGVATVNTAMKEYRTYLADQGPYRDAKILSGDRKITVPLVVSDQRYQGEILSEEQVQALETAIGQLERKKSKSGSEYGVKDLPQVVVRNIVPRINKDGKMVHPGVLHTLSFANMAQVETAIDKSRAAGFKRVTKADEINAEYERRMREWRAGGEVEAGVDEGVGDPSLRPSAAPQDFAQDDTRAAEVVRAAEAEGVVQEGVVEVEVVSDAGTELAEVLAEVRSLGVEEQGSRTEEEGLGREEKGSGEVAGVPVAELLEQRELLEQKLGDVQAAVLARLVEEGKLELVDVVDEMERDPAVLAVQEELRNLDSRLGAYKIATSEELAAADIVHIERLRKWMKENLPAGLFKAIDVDQLADGLHTRGVAVGRFLYAMDKLGRVTGTIQMKGKRTRFAYHEAFHAVFRVLLKDEQIDKYLAVGKEEALKKLRAASGELREVKSDEVLLEEALEELKNLHPTFYGRMSREELEARYYEEHMADAFEQWKKDRKVRTPNLFRMFFAVIQRLADWLSGKKSGQFGKVASKVLGIKRSELERLFYDIDGGEFKNAEVANNRFTRELEPGGEAHMAWKHVDIILDYKLETDGKRTIRRPVLMPDGKAVELVSSITATVLQRRREQPGVDMGTLLNGVMDDYAALYDKKRMHYLKKLQGDRASIREYTRIAPELDRLRKLFSEGRGQIVKAVQDHLEEIFGEGVLRGAAAAAARGKTGRDERNVLQDEAVGVANLIPDLKAYLSSIVVPAEDDYGNSVFVNGQPLMQAVNIEELYTGLQKSAANVRDINKMLQDMEQFGVHNAATRAFMKQFKEDVGLEPSESGYRVTKNKNLFYMVMKAFDQYTPDHIYFNKYIKEERSYLVKLNTYDSLKAQVSLWYNSFMKLFYSKLHSQKKDDPEQQAFITHSLEGVQLLVESLQGHEITDEDLNERSLRISNYLKERLGIDLHQTYIAYSIASEINEKKRNPSQKSLVKTYEKLRVNALTRKSVQDLLNMLKEGKNPFHSDMDSEDLRHVLQEDPSGRQSVHFQGTTLARVKGRVKRFFQIGYANAFFDETVHTTSFKGADGTRTSSYQYPDFFMVRTHDLATGLKEDPTGQSVEWMKNPYFYIRQPINYLMQQKNFRYMGWRVEVGVTHGMGPMKPKLNWELSESGQAERVRETGVKYMAYTYRDNLMNVAELYLMANVVARPKDNYDKHEEKLKEEAEKNKKSRQSRDKEEAEAKEEFRKSREKLRNVRKKKAKGKDVIEEEKNNVMFMTSQHRIGPVGNSDTSYMVELPVQQLVELKIEQVEKKPGMDADGWYEDVIEEEEEIKDDKKEGEVKRKQYVKKFSVHLTELAREALVEEVFRECREIKDAAQVRKRFLEGAAQEKGDVVIEGYHTGDNPKGLQLSKTGHMLSADLRDTLEKSAARFHGTFEEYRDRVGKELELYWLGKDGLIKDGVVHELLEELVRTGIIHREKRDGITLHANRLLPYQIMKGFHGDDRKSNDEKNAMMNIIPDRLQHNLAQLLLNDYLNTNALHQMLYGNRAKIFDDPKDMSAHGDTAFFKAPSVHFEVAAPELEIAHGGEKSHVVHVRNMPNAEGAVFLTPKALRYMLYGSGKLTSEQVQLLDVLNRLEEVGDLGVWGPSLALPTIRMVYNDGVRSIEGMATVLLPGQKGDLGALRDRLEAYEKAHNTFAIATPLGSSHGERANVAEDLGSITDWNFREMDNRYLRIQVEAPGGMTEQEVWRVQQGLIGPRPSAEDDKAVGKYERLKDVYLRNVADRGRHYYEAAVDEVFGMEDVRQEVAASQAAGRVTPKLGSFLRKALAELERAGADSQFLSFFSVTDEGEARYNLNLPQTAAKFEELFTSYFSRAASVASKVPVRTVSMLPAMGRPVVRQVLSLDENGRVKESRVVPAAVVNRDQGLYADALDIRKGEEGLATLFGKNQGAGQPTFVVDSLRSNVPVYGKDAGGNEVVLDYYDECIVGAPSVEVEAAVRDTGRVPAALSDGLAMRNPGQGAASSNRVLVVDVLPGYHGDVGVFADREGRTVRFDRDRMHVGTRDVYTRKDGDAFWFIDPSAVRPQDISFHAYGEETSAAGAFEEYLVWMARNDERVKEGLIGPRPSAEDDKAVGEHGGVKDLSGRERVEAVMKELGLPASVEEYTRVKKAKGRELNVGRMNNAILDAQLGLGGIKRLRTGGARVASGVAPTTEAGVAAAEETTPTEQGGVQEAGGMTAPAETPTVAAEAVPEEKVGTTGSAAGTTPTEALEQAKVFYIPLAEVNTDPKRFQPRMTAYSEESANKLIENFDDNLLDPVVLFQDSSGKNYVLSGHSRLEAHRKLDALADDDPRKQAAIKKGFQPGKIKSRYFKGTEEEAREFADRSNDLATKNKDYESAASLRRMRQNKTAEKDIIKRAKEDFGKNWKFIHSLSFLNPNGKVIGSLRQFEANPDKDIQGMIEKSAQWIGAARFQFNVQLTDQHETELFDFLMDKKKSTKLTREGDLMGLLQSIIGKFDYHPNEPLNLYKLKSKSSGEITHEIEERDIKQAIKDKEKELATLNDRLNNPKNPAYVRPDAPDYEQVLAIADKKRQQINAELTAFRKELLAHIEKKGQVLATGLAQTSLFDMNNLAPKEQKELDEELEKDGINLDKIEAHEEQNAEQRTEETTGGDRGVAAEAGAVPEAVQESRDDDGRGKEQDQGGAGGREGVGPRPSAEDDNASGYLREVDERWSEDDRGRAVGGVLDAVVNQFDQEDDNGDVRNDVRARLEREGNMDQDHVYGKAIGFRNTKEASEQVPGVQEALSVFPYLHGFGVEQRKETSDGEPIWHLEINEVAFDSYGNSRAYNPVTGKFDGPRVGDVLSSLQSAVASNEVRERLAALLDFNPEALGIVGNMVAQGVPLEWAVTFMMQPIIQDYYRKIKTLSSPIKTGMEGRKAAHNLGWKMLEDERNHARVQRIREELEVELKQEMAEKGVKMDDEMYGFVLKRRLKQEIRSRRERKVEEVGLTDAMLRSNIQDKGVNRRYQYSVLKTFMRLQEQGEYHSTLQKLLGAIQQPGKVDPKMVRVYMEQLGLLDNDKEFGMRKVPLDLRQLLLGPASATRDDKVYDRVSAAYLDMHMDADRRFKEVFLSRTDFFQDMVESVLANLDVVNYRIGETEQELKTNLLSHLFIRAYKKGLSDLGVVDRLWSLSNGLIYNETKGKKPEQFMNVVEVLEAIRERFPDNSFVKFLHSVPTHMVIGTRWVRKEGREEVHPDDVIEKEDEPGKYIVVGEGGEIIEVEGEDVVQKNTYNTTGLNKVEINVWSKLNRHEVQRLKSDFLKIYDDKVTNHLAWALFHYLLVKDGGQFKQGSFLPYLPTFMFRDLSEVADKVHEAFLRGDTATFKEVFGMGKHQLLNEFTANYITHPSNIDHAPKVHMLLEDKNLFYSNRFQKIPEVQKYIPKVLRMPESGVLEFDFWGGMKPDVRAAGERMQAEEEDEEGKKETPKERIARRKFEKHVAAFKGRMFKVYGFEEEKQKGIEDIQDAEELEDYDESLDDIEDQPAGVSKQKGYIEFPFMVYDEYEHEDEETIELRKVYYVLDSIDGVAVDTAQAISFIDETRKVARGTRARYVEVDITGSKYQSASAAGLYEKLSPEWEMAEWAPGDINNHAGYGIAGYRPTAQEVVEAYEREERLARMTADYVPVVVRFEEEWGYKVRMVQVNEETSYVEFLLGEELAPNQEELEKAFYKMVNKEKRRRTKEKKGGKGPTAGEEGRGLEDMRESYRARGLRGRGLLDVIEEEPGRERFGYEAAEERIEMMIDNVLNAKVDYEEDIVHMGDVPFEMIDAGVDEVFEAVEDDVYGEIVNMLKVTMEERNCNL